MLDRKTAPDTGVIDSVTFTKAEKITFKNGIDLYSINVGNDEVTKLDVYFPAGIKQQQNLCVAAATNALIQEGSKKYSAAELADKFDFYGAFIQNSCGIQEASYSLFTLNKHFKNSVILLQEMLYNASFPEEETQIYQRGQKQRLQISLQKNSVLARQAFYKSLFGKKHLLGMFAEPSDYDALSGEQIAEFYQQSYHSNLPVLMLSGKVDDAILKNLEDAFSHLSGAVAQPPENLSAEPIRARYELIEKTDSLQAAIRIGKTTISRNHPDYRGLQLVNLILGGYFGSRLMKNIREEKGLTYGIHSSVEAHNGVGVFSIATEVNNKDHAVAVEEIQKELDRMYNEFVSEQELNKAKNYLLGSFVRSFDGPFAQADRFKILHDFDLPYSYYNDFIQKILSVSIDDIKLLSNKYLNRNEMLTTVVGSSK